jgi:hypothetical protein
MNLCKVILCSKHRLSGAPVLSNSAWACDFQYWTPFNSAGFFQGLSGSIDQQCISDFALSLWGADGVPYFLIKSKQMSAKLSRYE